jgi:hypothetical protein
MTRGRGRLKPSGTAPALQYGGGPSSDFLTKTLGVNILLEVNAEKNKYMSRSRHQNAGQNHEKM